MRQLPFPRKVDPLMADPVSFVIKLVDKLQLLIVELYLQRQEREQYLFTMTLLSIVSANTPSDEKESKNSVLVRLLSYTAQGRVFILSEQASQYPSRMISVGDLALDLVKKQEQFLLVLIISLSSVQVQIIEGLTREGSLHEMTKVVKLFPSNIYRDWTDLDGLLIEVEKLNTTATALNVVKFLQTTISVPSNLAQQQYPSECATILDIDDELILELQFRLILYWVISIQSRSCPPVAGIIYELPICFIQNRFWDEVDGKGQAIDLRCELGNERVEYIYPLSRKYMRQPIVRRVLGFVFISNRWIVWVRFYPDMIWIMPSWVSARAQLDRVSILLGVKGSLQVCLIRYFYADKAQTISSNRKE